MNFDKKNGQIRDGNNIEWGNYEVNWGKNTITVRRWGREYIYFLGKKSKNGLKMTLIK